MPTKYSEFVHSMNTFSIFEKDSPFGGRGAKLQKNTAKILIINTLAVLIFFEIVCCFSEASEFELHFNRPAIIMESASVAQLAH